MNSFKLFVFLLSLLVSSCAFSLPAACAPSHHDLAAGVSYEQLCRTSPEGQPWSIHVLRVNRKSEISIHGVEGQNERGEMKRELPTALAKREQMHGHKVFAAVNGDFDFVKPESMMGVPEGVAIIDGKIWTSEHTNRPVLAFTAGGKPIIGVPKVSIDVASSGKHLPIAALNKPFDTTGSNRLFTDEFRSSVAFDRSFSTVIVGNLSGPTPLPVNHTVTGKITDISRDKTNLSILPRGIVLTGVDAASLKVGDKIKLKVDVKVEGKRVRYAIGGLPILVRDGKKSIEGESGENLKKRHPRTAVCYNRQSVIFTVVDGRQPKLSVGMTLDELASLMVDLGCEAAMNTDGGGSSVMAIANQTSSSGVPALDMQIVNSPSDGHERGRGNAWVIESK